MNLEQALEIATEYCWRNYPSYLKNNLSIKDFKLSIRLEQSIENSFERLVNSWGEDNITPKDIHLLIESWAIARCVIKSFDEFNYSLVRR